jgi:ParB-like chromosome segregation protein Spo0J
MEWKLVKVNTKSLKKHPKNPRTLSREQAEQLQKSLDKFGQVEKIIINTDNQIIGGHQRFTLLKKQGVKELECWMPDRTLDEQEVEELLLRLNRNHGEFSYDDLANNFNVPDLLDFGFTIEELELKEIDDIESEEDDKKKEKRCPHCDGIL